MGDKIVPPPRATIAAGKLKIPDPDIGGWYRDCDSRLFEVVAVDASDGSIEIQHFDGTVEELDPQDWVALVPRVMEPPEDWSGAMDMSADDYLTELDEEPGAERGSPLDRLDDLE